MANTHTSWYYQVIFSTSAHEPWLTAPIRECLWPYVGGIARDNGMKALEIGGVADPAHVLIGIPPAT